MSKFEIKKEFNHYSLYVDDVLYCTADTYEEAEDDIVLAMLDDIEREKERRTA